MPIVENDSMAITILDSCMVG